MGEVGRKGRTRVWGKWRVNSQTESEHKRRGKIGVNAHRERTVNIQIESTPKER